MRRLARIGLLIVAVTIAACSSDDGAEVRNLGEENAESEGASASASGASSGSSSSPASGDTTGDATSDGGYDYASDVSAHRLVVEDVCDIAALLDAESIDFEAVEDIYRNGEHSVNGDGSVRTLAGFATADDRNHGLDEYYDTATPLDDWVTEALAGTGRFANQSDGVRAQAIEKGVQNQIMVAWTIHELETAVAKAEDGDVDPASGAPHNWDEGWAFYHGASPSCAPYATADSRAENFGTTGSGTTSLVNEAVLEAMIEGRDALIAGDADLARAAADDVVRNLVITYSQAAIRYASLVPTDVENGDLAAAAEHRAEGLAFFRVIEAIVADAGGDAGAIRAIYDFADDQPGSVGGGDDVRAALEPAWDTLGISAEDIGMLDSE